MCNDSWQAKLSEVIIIYQMTHPYPHPSKRTFNFIHNATKTKIIFTFNSTGPGGGGGWRFGKSSEEVEAEKSILQTSSSQLLYKICENGSCKLDDESIVCVNSEIIKYLLS